MVVVNGIKGCPDAGFVVGKSYDDFSMSDRGEFPGGSLAVATAVATTIPAADIVLSNVVIRSTSFNITQCVHECSKLSFQFDMGSSKDLQQQLAFSLVDFKERFPGRNVAEVVDAVDELDELRVVTAL